MSVDWEHIGEAEWRATIGGRTYSVFRRPCPPKGEPAWAWLSLDPKRRSACGLSSSFDEAKRMAELDGAKIDEKA